MPHSMIFLSALIGCARRTSINSAAVKRIIAVRLIKRLQAKAIVSEEVANSLAAAITAFFKGRFLHDRILPEQVDHSGEELIKIATPYLDERASRKDPAKLSCCAE
jgi:hypothetical protein